MLLLKYVVLSWENRWEEQHREQGTNDKVFAIMQMREVGDYDDDIKEVNGTGFLQNSRSVAFGCKKQEDQEYLRRFSGWRYYLRQDLELRTQAESWDVYIGAVRRAAGAVVLRRKSRVGLLLMEI